MTTAEASTASLELGHYAAVLRRRVWVVVLAVVIGIGAAVGFLAVADRAVTATTLVNLNVISSDPFNTPRSAAEMIDPATETQVVTSSPVLQDAAAALGDGTEPSAIKADLSAKLVPDATVMRVSYSASDVETAERGADAIAEAYLTFRSSQAQDRVDTIVTRLDEERTRLRDDLVRLNTIIRSAPASSARAAQAESDRQLTSIELDSLSTQIDTYRGLDTTGGTVLTGASENTTQVTPSRAVVLGTGGALGLVLGVLAAFLLARTDSRVRDGYDVRRAQGGGVLGELRDREVAIPASPRDMSTIRTVRELLLARLPDNPPVVAVADLSSQPLPDVAANLALAVAETGRTVRLFLPGSSPTLVADVAKALDLAAVAGSDGHYANDDISLSAPSRGTGLPDRKEVAAATDAPGMTIVAVPHSSAHAALLEAGRLGHGVLLVVARGETRRADVVRAGEELAEVGARVQGTVMLPKGRTSGRRRST